MPDDLGLRLVNPKRRSSGSESFMSFASRRTASDALTDIDERGPAESVSPPLLQSSMISSEQGDRDERRPSVESDLSAVSGAGLLWQMSDAIGKRMSLRRPSNMSQSLPASRKSSGTWSTVGPDNSSPPAVHAHALATATPSESESEQLAGS